MAYKIINESIDSHVVYERKQKQYRLVEDRIKQTKKNSALCFLWSDTQRINQNKNRTFNARNVLFLEYI